MAFDLSAQVEAYCRKNVLLTPGDKIVVGVSGGPDSLCLLHVLKQLCRILHLAPPTVAHLNHQLRYPDSDHEAQFVQAIAAQWQLPFFVAALPVTDLAEQRKLSIEETARQVRYAFLAEVAQKVQANRIAVGHNADDQAETVLMHFLRGSGLTGLRGMLPKIAMAELSHDLPEPVDFAASPAIILIRPLLDTPRRDIEAYCQMHNLKPRYDASNQDTAYFRNRLRYELLPYLQQYNPNIRQLLCRTAKSVASDVALIEHQVDQTWPSIISDRTKNRIDFQRAVWLELPVALKRATLRRAIQQIRGNLLNISFEHIDNVIEILEKGRTGAEIMLPTGLLVRLDYQTIAIGFEQEVTALRKVEEPQLLVNQPLAIQVPGTVHLPSTDWHLHSEMLSLKPSLWQRIKQASRWEAFVDAAKVAEPLMLRSRQPGDRFYPLGSGHRKKVKNFMIDTKIPEADRSRIPLLTSGETIVWLCGYRLDERFKVTAETERMIHFTFYPY
ncbi:MAG: tRNA lysidine(34) synthetase TilS [Anaerolineae bacterium]|nr:tRNA lysidine(34) synthetase TilS [Anaerolineae bacterium]